MGDDLLSLLYLAFVATIARLRYLGARYWDAMRLARVAPLSLLVPVVGLASAAVLLGETLRPGVQLAGASTDYGWTLYQYVLDFIVRRTARVRG